QLKKCLSDIECAVVRAITEHQEWLSHSDASTVRWALSLARISKVMMKKDHPELDVNLEPAQDRYRAELYALLSPILITGGSIKARLLETLKNIENIAIQQRFDLLSLFGKSLTAMALDEATRRRPLTLTLSGGGGTSYVFLGALSALDEAGLVPCVITGSSMGAILGAYRARTKHFSLDGVDALVERTSWGKIAQPYSGPSRFGVPGTFRLYLRDVVGQEFEKDGQFLRIKDLAINLRVCVAGLSSAGAVKEEELQAYAHMLDANKQEAGKAKNRDKSIIAIIMDFAQKPLKRIYLGSDALTKEFDVLDAIGFAASIPGIFHYDILRNDPRMVALVTNLFEREGIIRLIDGGFVDNLPVTEAIKAVEDGECDGYDPFALALDGFTPGINRHILFYPVMRFAAENSKEGHEAAHLSIIFKDVLSPINLVPTKETLNYALQNGYASIAPHIPFVRKMVGPIPDPPWLKQL
ncbi:MAG TPA: patatin-like phospholipase family protein, partial [Myxococcota bacterium]|nr:patatin-like phospholipase family protein [Myxococcota bacterium]